MIWSCVNFTKDSYCSGKRERWRAFGEEVEQFEDALRLCSERVAALCVDTSWMFTCELCVKDLFVLLSDLLLVVFEQALTQVAHLPQRERGLVLL